MKPNPFILLMAVCAIAACGNDATTATSQKIANNPEEKDEVAWIDNFRDFRNAVYQRDKQKVKEYVNFPLLDSSNNIWYMVDAGDDKKVASLSQTVKPFTEKDFDHYFDSLFTKRFINCILKLKTEELVQKEEVESTVFTEGNTTYTMYATYDKRHSRLILNLFSKTAYQVDGETENAEFSEIYVFDIPANGKIKFIKMDLAG